MPSTATHPWEATARWAGQSDHAVVTLSRASPADRQPSLACSPARFAALPAEARRELRRNLDRVASSLGVPAMSGHTDQLPDLSPQRPGQTDPHDPCLELAEEHGRRNVPGRATDWLDTTGGAEPTGDNHVEITAWKPLLAVLGYTFIHATFNAWWRKWRKRRTPGCPVRAELVRLSRLRTDANGDEVDVAASPLLAS